MRQLRPIAITLQVSNNAEFLVNNSESLQASLCLIRTGHPETSGVRTLTLDRVIRCAVERALDAGTFQGDLVYLYSGDIVEI